MVNAVIPLGRKCREIRSRYGVKLHDQARNTRWSPSYISLIERGQRPIPDGFVEAFASWLGLSSQEAAELQEAAHQSAGRQTARTKSFRLQLAGEIAASVYSMPVAQLESLRTLIAQPSKPSYTEDEICERAALFRAAFNPHGKVEIDIVEIVETFLALVDPESSLVVEPDTSFRGQMETYSDQRNAKSRTIVTSERMYSTANRGNTSSRYALLHEFAHWVLHRDETHAFFRLAKAGRALGRHTAREYEADRFAREFVFPANVVLQFAKSDDLARASLMPANVAAKRFREISSGSSEKTIGSSGVASGATQSVGAANSPKIVPGLIEPKKDVVPSARVLVFPSLANQPPKPKFLKNRRPTHNGDDLFTLAIKRDAAEAERQARELEARQKQSAVDIERRRETSPLSVLRSTAFFREHGWRC
ncbi:MULTISPECIES: helix-turn-helix domain-containing protein [Bradyrhizobium]|uniref:helix-turn-helix domain-containing protein n=1 Tax=Bradyrhizobium TaxID=374 RepID=UPI0004B07BE1|nr:helix-turn-helix transcriptional regulator [Bradyrhizobium sp. CCBAU 15544]